MRKLFATTTVAAIALLLLSTATIQAQHREIGTAKDAIEVLAQSGKVEKGIPTKLLCDAQAVAIVPNVVKVGLILGGRHGHGVVLVRCRDGSWSNPIFVIMSGGSLGVQGGIQSTDLILVFKSQRGIERILKGKGKLTLGADAAVAAGPVGRETTAATDAQLKAEIYSYSRSRGLFAGLSLDGDTLRIDWNANGRFYGRPGVTPLDIVTNNGIVIHEPALILRGMLNAITLPPPVLGGSNR